MSLTWITSSHSRVSRLSSKTAERMAARLDEGDVPAAEHSYLQDQLGLLAARCQWVREEQQRSFLDEQVNSLWERLGGKP